jgi:flagellar biosynthetic protein FliR
VSGIGSDTVLLVFLLFCRIGGCLMIMPGFSSPRIPIQVRLFLSAAATLALTPLLLPNLQTALPDLSNARLAGLLISETLVGALIGMMGRFFFMALQFMATTVAQLVGLTKSGGTHIEDK